jgi:uncharacterized membrane protein YkvA (DUF1232 family)
MPKTITEQEARDQLKRGAEKATQDDLKKVIDRADEIKDKFETNGPLARFVKDVKLMISLVQDYWNGTYREIPWWVIAAVISALLYVLSPVDLIPDFIPFVGYLDDAMVVAACLLMVEQQLAEYEAWKKKQIA